MYDAVIAHFASEPLKNTSNYFETVDKDHGRIEIRKYWATNDIRCLAELPEFTGIKSIIMVERTRIIKGQTTVEINYFISSLGADAKKD